MYLDVSNAFKSTVKSRVITTKARLTFKNFFSDSSDLIIDKDISSEGLNLVDCCYDEENGKLIGTAALKEVEIEINNKNGYDLADKEFELEVGVLINRETLEYEYIPYGRYIVVSYEDLKSSNKYKIIADDMMCKLNPKFKENEAFKPTYPITAKEYYRQLMASYGIEIEDQVLPNAEFIIKTALEFEENTGRYVLGRLAELFGSFAKINRKNKCQMYLKTETDEVMEMSQMNSTLEIDKRYGPVNVVTIGMSQVEGENVTLLDHASIVANGETTIRIDDNEFLYTEQLREQAITPLYERLRGFTYIPVKFKHRALLYTDCGDSLQVRNMANGELVDTIILNQYIQVPRTRQSSIESPALTNAEQKYKYISNSKQAQTQTEIKVDKQLQTIESVVSQTTEQNEKINRVVQTVDELNSKISDIADITISTEKNIARVELEKINESEPIRVVIHPITEHIATTVPSDTLFPSNMTFPRNSVILRFENTETNEQFDYTLPDNLYYYDEEYYDEFILDYDSLTCLINKRVGINQETGEAYVLEAPKTIDYEYPLIALTDGDYVISIVGYDVGYLFVRLMSQNIYTTQLATKVEMNSKIEQTTKNLELSVNQKLDGYTTDEELSSAIEMSAKNISLSVNEILKNYSTTTQMNSAIELESGKINAEVNKKVGNSEVIAKFNLAIKDKQGIINFVGNIMTIDTDYFKLTKEGKLTATSGDIAGWTINSSYLGKGLAGIKGIANTTSNDDVFYAGQGLGYNNSAAFRATNKGDVHVKSLSIRGRTASDIGKISIYNENAQVGTTLTYDTVNGYYLTASNGGSTPTKGKCMHGYSMNNDFRCDWDGSRLYFMVDDANIGYVMTHTSDVRLKKDITDLPPELMHAIEEVEFKQFKLIKGNDKFKYGIIAQDLVQAFNKYGLNYKEYEIVEEVQVDLTDKTLYFMIDYEQVLILKNQLLEDKVKSLERKVEKILEKLDMA